MQVVGFQKMNMNRGSILILEAAAEPPSVSVCCESIRICAGSSSQSIGPTHHRVVLSQSAAAVTPPPRLKNRLRWRRIKYSSHRVEVTCMAATLEAVRVGKQNL